MRHGVGLGLVVALFVVLGMEAGRCDDCDFLGLVLRGCFWELVCAVRDQAEEWKVRCGLDMHERIGRWALARDV
jgi:hypothetical protein